MREFNLVFLIAVSLLLFVSCSILSEEPNQKITVDDIVFQTDQTSYISHQNLDESWPTFRFTLIARFENRSYQTIYLARCRSDSPQPMYGLKLLNQEETKRSGYGKVYACSQHNQPIAVRPRSVRIDTIHVMGPTGWQHGTHEPLGVLEGEYKLGYELQTCRSGNGCRLPDSLSRSNEFEVILAD